MSREKYFVETPKTLKSTASWNVIDSSTLLIPEEEEKKKKAQERRGFPGQGWAQTIEKLLILKVGSHSHQQRVQQTGLVIAAQGWNFP